VKNLEKNKYKKRCMSRAKVKENKGESHSAFGPEGAGKGYAKGRKRKNQRSSIIPKGGGGNPQRGESMTIVHQKKEKKKKKRFSKKMKGENVSGSPGNDQRPISFSMPWKKRGV